MLRTAILTHKCTKITYAASSMHNTTRIIYPLKLAYKGQAWYLKSGRQQSSRLLFRQRNRQSLCLGYEEVKSPQEKLQGRLTAFVQNHKQIPPKKENP